MQHAARRRPHLLGAGPLLIGGLPLRAAGAAAHLSQFVGAARQLLFRSPVMGVGLALDAGPGAGKASTRILAGCCQHPRRARHPTHPTRRAHRPTDSPW